MTLIRSRAAIGVALTLLSLGLAAGGVLVLADKTGSAAGEFAPEISLTFAVCFGWALGSGLESFFRGERDWGELMWFRLCAGTMVVFFAILGVLLALQAAGVGSGNL